jgi:hypothetical protein
MPEVYRVSEELAAIVLQGILFLLTPQQGFLKQS